jgi:hypothetical protein
VALQLAELKRVSMMSAAKIRQVIQSLPPTLDAFYERSLLDIDSFQSEQAHTLLQWIAFSPHPLTLAELAEVLVIQPETECQLDYRGPVFCSLILTALTSLSVVANNYSRLQLYIPGYSSIF